MSFQAHFQQLSFLGRLRTPPPLRLSWVGDGVRACWCFSGECDRPKLSHFLSSLPMQMGFGSVQGGIQIRASFRVALSQQGRSYPSGKVGSTPPLHIRRISEQVRPTHQLPKLSRLCLYTKLCALHEVAYMYFQAALLDSPLIGVAKRSQRFFCVLRVLGSPE